MEASGSHLIVAVIQLWNGIQFENRYGIAKAVGWARANNS